MASFFLNNTTSVTSNGTLLNPGYTGASLRVDYSNNNDYVRLNLNNTTGNPAFGANATEASLVGVAFDVADGLNVSSWRVFDTNTSPSTVAPYWNAHRQTNTGLPPFTGTFDYTVGKLPSVGGDVNDFKVEAGDDLDLVVHFHTAAEVICICSI